MGRMNWEKCYMDNAKPVFDDDERERRMIEMSLSYEGSDDEDTINRRRKKRKTSTPALYVRDQIRKEILERGALDNIDLD